MTDLSAGERVYIRLLDDRLRWRVMRAWIDRLLTPRQARHCQFKFDCQVITESGEIVLCHTRRLFKLHKDAKSEAK